jgi:hypothetical protein
MVISGRNFQYVGIMALDNTRGFGSGFGWVFRMESRCSLRFLLKGGSPLLPGCVASSRVKTILHIEYASD